MGSFIFSLWDVGWLCFWLRVWFQVVATSSFENGCCLGVGRAVGRESSFFLDFLFLRVLGPFFVDRHGSSERCKECRVLQVGGDELVFSLSQRLGKVSKVVRRCGACLWCLQEPFAWAFQ